MSAILAGRAAKAMKSPAYPKFAATVSDLGVPNVVPLLSAKMIDHGDHGLRPLHGLEDRPELRVQPQTRLCLPRTQRPELRGAGRVCGMGHPGPLLERFEEEAMYRYNAYMGANVVGVMKVKAVRDFESGGFWGPVLKTILSRLPMVGAPFRARSEARTTDQSRLKSLAPTKDTNPMAPQIIEKWSRALALKFIAIADENGNPLAFSHQGLAAPDPRTLTFPLPKSPDHPLAHLQPGAPVAASVFCPDPVAYQVKGTFAGIENNHGHPLALLTITETFSASPPVPGRRLYPMEGIA